jgi:rhodanese-related sulfurtransferase
MVATVKQMIEAAEAVVPRIAPAQARAMIAHSEALIVDVRDTPEVEQGGKVPGSVHISRGMLEFRADSRRVKPLRSFRAWLRASLDERNVRLSYFYHSRAS